MTSEEAIRTLKELAKSFNGYKPNLDSPFPDRAIEYLKEGLDKAREQYLADGCRGCAFADVEELQDPCRMCKRNCKDYWRAKE